MSNSSE
ncbi:hypothetical protein PENFLA_c052G05087 [Penicillium flavigenum]|nr:hypothetical protein PENFLA_c052G05087 [Penicillium flavigenum]